MVLVVRQPGETLTPGKGGTLVPVRSFLGQWISSKTNQPGHDAAAWQGEKGASSPSPPNRSLHPTLVAFKEAVESDRGLKLLSQAMFDEIPIQPPYDKDPLGDEPQVRDFDSMLRALNVIITEGVPFFRRTEPAHVMAFVGAPVTIVLNWPMATRSGCTFFLDRRVNDCLRDYLNSWGAFLCSKESQACLVDVENGWLSSSAMELLTQGGNNGRGNRSFSELYVCDPSKRNYGFDSWDEFFIREFRPGVRPVEVPDDQPACAEYPDPTAVIVNSCESTPYNYATNVQFRDTFWLKGQDYSLVNMLDDAPNSIDFIGGTVHQSFLSAMSYHRWHAPVGGRVRSVKLVAGTYFAGNLYAGFANPEGGPDDQAGYRSQPYFSAIATRAIIFIEADNAAIGLMAIVYIGMAEVSSCEFTVKAGDRVKKGEQLGMFHFGGSSYCMVFRPETRLRFVGQQPPWNQSDETNNSLNSVLAVASAAT